MKNNQLMIYGAYGYAGELMVREAVAQGLRPIIAGRDAEKLKPIATELSLECRAFGVRNTGSNLQDISVLLNCAGPFSATAEPLARACLAQQIHYLDITGEIDIFRKCHALDEEARQQNVLICQVPEPTSCQPTVWRRCLRRNCPSPRASIWLSRSAPIQVSARSTP